MTALQHARARRGGLEVIRGGAMSDDGAMPPAPSKGGGYGTVPNSIARCSILSRDARATYAVLKTYAWQEPSCYPSMEALQGDLGASQKSVWRYLDELERFGAISIEKRGQGQTNIYHLTAEFPIDQSPVTTQTPPDQSAMTTQSGPPETLSSHPCPLDQSPVTTPLKEDKTQDKTQRTTPNGVGAGAPRPLGDEAAQNHEAPGPVASPPSKRAPKAVAPAIPEWLDPLVDAVGAAIGWRSVGAATRGKWRPLLLSLAECGDEERQRFPGWLISGGTYWRDNAHRLSSGLRLECEAFVSAGCPRGKANARAGLRQGGDGDAFAGLTPEEAEYQKFRLERKARKQAAAAAQEGGA